MYNLFKKILPALRSRFFGNTTELSLPPKVVSCHTLYIYDTYTNTYNIEDYTLSLNIKDQQSWEINDGCG